MALFVPGRQFSSFTLTPSPLSLVLDTVAHFLSLRLRALLFIYTDPHQMEL